MKAVGYFTLVELLICCVIFMITGSLLLPALNKVRLAASKTQCMNTLRQLGIAESCYIFCNDGFMLPVMTDGKNWAELLAFCTGELCLRTNRNEALPTESVPLCSRSIYENGRKIKAGIADVFTLWNDTGTVVKDMGGFTKWVEMGGYGAAHPLVKTAELRRPSDKITIFDGYYYVLMLSGRFGNLPEEGVTAWGVHEPNRINTLSADGHAGTMPRCRMEDITGGISVRQRHFQPEG